MVNKDILRFPQLTWDEDRREVLDRGNWTLRERSARILSAFRPEIGVTDADIDASLDRLQAGEDADFEARRAQAVETARNLMGELQMFIDEQGEQ